MENQDTLDANIEELPTPKSPEIPTALTNSQDADGKRRAYQNLPEIPTLEELPKKRLFKKTSMSTSELGAVEQGAVSADDAKNEPKVIREEHSPVKSGTTVVQGESGNLPGPVEPPYQNAEKQACTLLDSALQIL